ncbi:exopolyphosphatase [Afipia sp. P52-10]|jgi:exopolyphosphatase/guanosine-5'-triphosphate,3'-diphosphate pyrophosphatase|uniref:Ppx/GppA phosphatase family protein n=1 Tax=Afipia sp. P52-10 TaxID=1429916 RepID=UPI0003DF38ED|nr:Ppx/GppA phosphatase family protein [Afipia sp. P52-10]ETR74827.1 exopolyphosphatase [Afipia sp. P52-10]
MEHESWPRYAAEPRVDTHEHISPRQAVPVRTRLSDTAYAALDLGTNNCRLLIARPTANNFRIVDSFSRIIRLGEGLAQTGRISELAIERALSALRVCRDKIVAKRATRTRLIATEACRTAANTDRFRERVDRELGIRLEVIDRETEAMLAVTGCLPLLDPGASGAILFDIGGGSSELVRLDRIPGLPDATPKISGWVSLPVGVVTLAERRGGVDVTPQAYAAMVSEVAEMLAPFALTHGRDLGGMHLLGTSGTVTTVAGIFLDLPRYDRRRVDGLWMSDADVTHTVDRLLAMSYQERVHNACIGTERGDLVLAGCAILDAIRMAFPCPRLRIADRGLREGMLVQMMREDGLMRTS